MTFTVQSTVPCASGNAVIKLEPEGIYVCAGVKSIRNAVTNALTLQASATEINADGTPVINGAGTSLSHTLAPGVAADEVSHIAKQCLYAVLGEPTDGTVAWSANVLAQSSIRRAVAMAALGALDAASILGEQ